MPKRTLFFDTCFGVFQGGGCRAAAFAGAYEEALRRGVRFSEVAGTSAGSIVAALIGAGSTPKDLSDRLQDLDFTQFIQPPKPQRSRPFAARIVSGIPGVRQALDLFYDDGLHSADQLQAWIDECLSALLPGAARPIAFKDLLIPTWIVAADTVRESVVVWNTRDNPTESVARAVRASCSIPLFYQPLDGRFVDGGVLANLPSFVFSTRNRHDRPLAGRVLAFALRAEGAMPSESPLLRLAGTIVDGSQSLQLAIQDDVPVLTIPTGAIRATDFDKMTPAAIRGLIENGRAAASDFFEDELGRMRVARSADSVLQSKDELYSAIAQQIGRTNDVLIAQPDTTFVYPLFPTILSWRMAGVRLRVVLPAHTAAAPDSTYQRSLLKALGAEIAMSSSSFPYAYLFDANDPLRATAFVGVPESPTQKLVAVRYESPIDLVAINSLARSFEPATFVSSAASPLPRLAKAPWDPLLKLLRGVSQYSSPSANLTVQEVPIKSLVSLTRFVREFKLRQIYHLSQLFHESRIPLFAPAVAQFADGQQSFVTPPVVEKSGIQFILLEGTTRATYCRENAIDSLWCVVVDGVSEALPSDRVEFSRVRVVGRTTDPETRYPNFNYGSFRHIERAVHLPGSLK